MDLKSPAVRRTLALVIAVAGILIAWLALDAVGLLVGVAAMCIWLRARMGLLSVVAGSLIWGAILWIRPPAEHDGLVRFAIFVAAALGVWLLVQVFRTTSMTDMLDQNSSDLVVEDIPGLGWIGHPDGRLRYINPDVLALIGVSAEEMRKMLAADPLRATWELMVERRLQNLPLLGPNRRPVGTLDIRDALQAIIELEQAQEKQLVNYITGVGYR